MPQVSCPSCQTLLSLDPRQGSEFECPTCGQVLRLKIPNPAASLKPRPAPTDDVRRLEDPEPAYRAKKKRRGPTGRVSWLLMPLGGLAMVVLIVANFVEMHAKARERNVELGPVAYIAAFSLTIVGLAIGGAITRFSVNSLAKRNRVPELDFSESTCLYSVVSFAGGLGSAVFVVPLLIAMAGKAPQAPGDAEGVGLKIFFMFVMAIAGFFAAGAPTVKFLLNTRWSDAASICARFLLVVVLTVVAFFVVVGALIAAAR